MDIQTYMQDLGRKARAAASLIARADSASKNAALLHIAELIEQQSAAIKAANQADLDAARANGMEAAMLDRLALSDKAMQTMATGLRQIANLPDPVGEISNLKQRPTGIQVGQMRVPLGVPHR